MFEWDEAKSEATLRLCGFDFDYASRIFENPVLEFGDRRRTYGERGIVALGRVGSNVLFVVYTWRDRTRRIISA